MKTLDNTNLGYLLTKIKNAFIRTTDVESVSEVTIDATPTANSDNLVTSGGVYSALGDKISKSSTAGLVKNDGTIDTNTYLTSHDFTHVADTTVTTSTTVTFAANTRGSQMVSTAADLDIAFVVNNSADNYLWIKNTGSADIDITISGVTYNTTALTDVYIPDGGISVPAGKVCEIGIVCNADGAFITSRNDLTL